MSVINDDNFGEDPHTIKAGGITGRVVAVEAEDDPEPATKPEKRRAAEDEVVAKAATPARSKRKVASHARWTSKRGAASVDVSGIGGAPVVRAPKGKLGRHSGASSSLKHADGTHEPKKRRSADVPRDDTGYEARSNADLGGDADRDAASGAFLGGFDDVVGSRRPSELGRSQTLPSLPRGGVSKKVGVGVGAAVVAVAGVALMRWLRGRHTRIEAMRALYDGKPQHGLVGVSGHTTKVVDYDDDFDLPDGVMKSAQRRFEETFEHGEQ